MDPNYIRNWASKECGVTISMESTDQNQPLLAEGLDSNSQILYLSSDAIEELLSLHKPVPTRWWLWLAGWESKLLWRLSWPSILFLVCNYLISSMTLMFTGHLSALQLAGASIVSVALQALASGIMLGMSNAVQTLGGQAYGAKKYSAMGIICQRTIILQLGAALLLTFLFWYSGPVLQALGQSESTAEQGQGFARALIPQLYAMAIYSPLQKFLQAQNIVNPLAYMAVGVLLLHILLTWIVISVLNCELIGAGLTQSFSWWLLAIMNWLYIVFSPSCKQTWTGFSIKAFKGLWPIFKLAVASAIMMSLLICYFGALTLIAGLLPNSTISVDSISIRAYIWNLNYTFLTGISTATSIRVSNKLGAYHPLVAKFLVVVVCIISMLISIFFTTIVAIFQYGLAKLYTSDIEVIEAVSNLTPMLAACIFLNGVQVTLSGVAIGSGWQALAASINLTSYYIIGLPIGCVLAFKTSLKAAGILGGVTVGAFLQSTCFIILTAKTNWNAEAEKAATSVKKSANEEALDLVDGI